MAFFPIAKGQSETGASWEGLYSAALPQEASFLCTKPHAAQHRKDPQVGHFANCGAADLVYNPLSDTSYTNQVQTSAVFLKLKIP